MGEYNVAKVTRELAGEDVDTDHFVSELRELTTGIEDGDVPIIQTTTAGTASPDGPVTQTLMVRYLVEDPRHRVELNHKEEMYNGK